MICTREQKFWVPRRMSLNQAIANDRGNRFGAAKKLRAEKDEVSMLALSKLRAVKGRVFIEFLWVEPNRRRDPDNVSSQGRKIILDGLVRAGIIEGDGWRTVAGFSDQFLVAGPGEMSGCHVILVPLDEMGGDGGESGQT